MRVDAIICLLNTLYFLILLNNMIRLGYNI